MKSYKFILSTRSDDPCILNMENSKKDNSLIDDEQIKEISKKFKHNELFIISPINYNSFKRIWTDKDADIVLVNNVDILKNDDLNEVFYFVNDEDRIVEDLVELYINSNSINLRFRHFFTYDKSKLIKQFELLSRFIIDSFKSGIIKNIYQLTGFLFESKFDEFGDGSFFISPDMKVYSHPSFYYSNSKHGIISNNVFDFDEDDELNTHYTKPHLICRTCECFYCDRNIYYNKKETSEYKVPSFEQCNKTTFLNKFSRKIFNAIQDSIKLEENINLDRSNIKITAETEFLKLENNEIISNNIKKIDLNYLRNPE